MAKKKASSASGLPLIILLIAAVLLIGVLLLWESKHPLGRGSQAQQNQLNQGQQESQSGEQTQRPWGREIVPEPGNLPPPRGRGESLDAISRDKAYAGFPRPIHDDTQVRILQNSAFVTGYSDKRKNPLWTAFKLTPDRQPVNYKRPKEFRTDDRTAARVHDSDFRNTGYQRGHMAPNSPIADCWGQKAQVETFLLSNICPQTPALNEKVWENMERAEATHYSRGEPVWIICGPLFSNHPAQLKHGVQVPEHFYRIVVRERAGRPQVMAFDVPQSVNGDEQPRQFLTRVRDIEKQSDLDFMWELPDDIENDVETHAAASVWPN